MATAQTKFYEAASTPVQVGRGTVATLSGSTTATEGVAVTYTVTLNAAADQTYTITPSASDSGAVSPSTRTITAGNTTGTFTVTWAAAGAGRTVDFTISPSLTRAGRPITVTVNAASEPSLATGDPEFTLLSASSGTIPFTVGQAVREGNMPSASGIAVVGATGQVKIKSTWDDGSAKIVIVSGTAALTADTPLTVTLESGTSSTGTALDTTDLQSAMTHAVTITAGAYGNASWSGTDWLSPFVSWVSGHEMSSWVFRKQVGTDDHLVGWLEVRLYASGAVEVLPWIENGYLDVASPATRSAVYTFAMGGTTRYDSGSAIDLLSHTRTPLISGSVTSYWQGTAHDVIVTHEGGYLQSTGLVPAYMVEIADDAPTIASLPTTFAPLQIGMFDAQLASGGYHTHVCIIPEWDALYCTTPAPEAYKGMVFQGYSAGRYDWNYRDPSTNRPLLMASYASETLATVEQPGSPSPSGSAMSIDHGPSLGYVPYLATGRWFFMDMVQMVAAWNYLACTNTTSRQTDDGIFDHRNLSWRGAAWGLRTLGQALTVTPDDDATQLAQWQLQLENNINWLHGRYVTTTRNPLGFLTPHTPYHPVVSGTAQAGSTTTVLNALAADLESTDVGDDHFVGWTLYANSEARTVTASTDTTLTVGSAFTSAPSGSWECHNPDYFSAPWQHDYLVSVWGYIKDLGPDLDVTTQGKLDAFFEQIAKSVVGRTGYTAADEWLYRDASPYTMAILPVPYYTFQDGTGSDHALNGPWFADWGEAYDHTYTANGTTDGSGANSKNPYQVPGTRVQGEMRWGDIPGSTVHQSQTANFMRALAYCIKHNATGAEDGWQRISSAGNWYEFRKGMQDLGRVTGALAPRALPLWRRGQAVNEWREIADSSMADCPNTNHVYDTNGVNPAVNSYGGRLDSYCGMGTYAVRSTLYTVAAGGHGDYFGNEIVKQDLRDDAPVWVIQHPGSDGNVVVDTNSAPGSSEIGTPGLARYEDGLPASRHTYMGTVSIERHRRIVSTGGSISKPGGAYQDLEAFDVDDTSGVTGWDAQYTYPGALNATGITTLIAPSTVKDPRTEIIYVFAAGTLHTITPDDGGGPGGTYAAITGMSWNTAYSHQEAACAVDITRGKILWTHGYDADSATQPYTFDISSGALDSRHTYSGTAAAALAAIPASCGVVYVPEIDRYLLRGDDPGDEVFSIHPTTFDVTLLSTTGGSGVPQCTGSGASGGSGDPQGVYNKWTFLPHLGGVAYVPSSSENTWFLRLS